MREQTTRTGNQSVSSNIGLAGVLMSSWKIERVSKAVAEENFSGNQKIKMDQRAPNIMNEQSPGPRHSFIHSFLHTTNILNCFR